MDLLAAVLDLQARVEALEAGGVIEHDEPESVSGSGKVGAVPEPDEDSGPVEGTMTSYVTPDRRGDEPEAEVEAEVELAQPVEADEPFVSEGHDESPMAVSPSFDEPAAEEGADLSDLGEVSFEDVFGPREGSE